MLGPCPADLQLAVPFHLRWATPADIPALMAMKQQMAIADGAPGLLDATADQWEEACFGPAPKFIAIVAEQAGAVVGMTIFNEQCFAGWAAPPLYVQDLFVMPAHRSRGIGRALLTEVASQARARKSRLVYLNVHENNQACRLYAGLGFRPAQKCQVYALVDPPLTALAGSGTALSPPTR